MYLKWLETFTVGYKHAPKDLEDPTNDNLNPVMAVEHQEHTQGCTIWNVTNKLIRRSTNIHFTIEPDITTDRP